MGAGIDIVIVWDMQGEPFLTVYAWHIHCSRSFLSFSKRNIYWCISIEYRSGWVISVCPGHEGSVVTSWFQTTGPITQPSGL